MATIKNSKLAKMAKENVSIQKKTSSGVEHIKEGTPLDHSNKHNLRTTPTVGMSKGVTKNMDNYESLRVDVWVSDVVQPDESMEEAIVRIESIVDNALEEAISNCIEE